MKKKILLVDDSKVMLTLLSGFFKTKYEVITKNSATDALFSIQEGALPDLIITDINMPELDGYEFVKQLKSTNLTSEIPVIILSNNQSSSDRLKSFHLGVDDYIGKPFNPEELLVRAEKLVNHSFRYTVNVA